MLKLLLSLIISLSPILVWSQKNLSIEEKMSNKYKVQLPSKVITKDKPIEGTLQRKKATNKTYNSGPTNQLQALEKQRKRIVLTLGELVKDSNADPAYVKKCEKALVITKKEIADLKQKIAEHKAAKPKK